MYYKNSFFSSVTETAGTENELACILDWIKTGVYADRITRIRELYAAEDNSEADVLKRSLPGFTPSATFSGGRKLENLKEYQQLLVLDVDKLESDKLQEVNQKARDCKYTLACFVSPSGHGLKILVKTTADQVSHGDCFAQVADYYETWLGVDIDRSGKDITRLCFVSHDPDLYISTDSEPWPFTVDSQDWAKVFQDAVSYTENVKEFEPGNRNNFVYQLACNLNRFGVPDNEALRLIMEKYQSVDFAAAEIQATVASAYKNISEFGTLASLASRFFENEEEIPVFPASVYELLPDFLKEITSYFTDERQRDIMLLSSLGVLSGIFPTVYGNYDNKRTHANLYLLVSAPPASGKGVMKYAERLVSDIHREWLDESQKSIEAHKTRYRGMKNPPQSPLLRTLLLPGDITQPALIDRLKATEGVGIMFATEADEVSQQWSKDWSNYSVTLRSAFHHEKISYSRKTNQEHVEIEQPKLSLILSGTLDQVSRLFTSAENGLFSRFLHYSFREKPKWRDVFSNAGSYDDIFKEYAQVVSMIYHFYKDSEFVFSFKKSQEEELNNFGRQLLMQVSENDGTGIATRLCLIWFRLAMVLTCIRQFNPEGYRRDLICSEEDFKICSTIIPLLFEHSLKVLSMLPKSSVGVSTDNTAHLRLLNALPFDIEIKRTDIMRLADGISERTLSNYLKMLEKQGLLTKVRQGVFIRPI